MKISYLIFLSFALIIFLFTLTTFINYKYSEQVRENEQNAELSNSIIRNSGRIQRNMLHTVSGLRGYLLTADTIFIDTYRGAVKENDSLSKELLISLTNKVQKKRFEEILALHNEWQTQYASPLINQKNRTQNPNVSWTEIMRNKSNATSARFGKIEAILQEKFKVFNTYEYETRAVQQKILENSYDLTKKLSLYLTALSIVIGFTIVGFTVYKISTRIKKMVNMANTIASGNYNVQVYDTGRDELSKLIQSLNEMARVLSENIQQLKRTNYELDQFAHIVSHDLKTPLGGIRGLVSWIEEDHETELPDKVREYMHLIKGCVSRSEMLIAGILSYARTGKEIYETEEVDVNELIREVKLDLVLPENCSIEIQGTLPTLKTNRLPLLQVFSNLISNAVKYNDKPDGYVLIYHKDHGTFFEFFVQDNGPGIADEHKVKIFAIFQTLQNTDTYESTGVGLAIVKKILDTRNETIQLQSTPGKGSVFSFTWLKTN